MARTKRLPEGPCEVGEAVEAIGGRWKGDILWWLRDGRKRFGELRKRIPAISPKVLTQELRELERDGLIEREQHAEIPPRVEYFMTPLGRSSLPVLDAIAGWWKKNSAAIRDAARKRK